MMAQNSYEKALDVLKRRRAELAKTKTLEEVLPSALHRFVPLLWELHAHESLDDFDVWAQNPDNMARLRVLGMVFAQYQMSRVVQDVASELPDDDQRKRALRRAEQYMDDKGVNFAPAFPNEPEGLGMPEEVLHDLSLQSRFFSDTALLVLLKYPLNPDEPESDGRRIQDIARAFSEPKAREVARKWYAEHLHEPRGAAFYYTLRLCEFAYGSGQLKGSFKSPLDEA